MLHAAGDNVGTSHGFYPDGHAQVTDDGVNEERLTAK